MAETVGQLVAQGINRLREAGVENPQLDTQLLAAHALGITRNDVIAHPERTLTQEESRHISALFTERELRRPLAYVLGHKEFFGLDLYVTPAVLVPRPETEVLVETVLARVEKPNSTVADVGTGSGAIALAIATRIPEACVYALDSSADALQVARANFAKHAADILTMEGNLVDPLKTLGTQFHAIVSNPPYVPSATINELQPEIALWEPRCALDGGVDGLDMYRQLVPSAFDVLEKDGFLALEVGHGQAAAVAEIAKSCGFVRVETASDLAGVERVVIAWA